MSASARAPFGLTFLLVALSAFGPMSTDIYLPALPEMTRIFQTDVSGAQLTLASFTATFAVAQLFYGPLSDRFGRRPLLIAGLAVFLLGTAICTAANSIDTMIGARIVQALGACAGPVLARAAVRDIYTRERAAQMMSFLAASVAIAPVIAPTIGGWLVTISWRYDFAVMLVFGALTLVGSWKLMAETNKHLDPNALDLWRMVETFGMLARDPVYVLNTAAVTFSFMSLYTYISLSSFVVIDVLGVRVENFGYWFAAPVLSFMAGSAVASRLAHRVPIERTIRVGTAFGVLGGLAILGFAAAHVQTVPVVILPVAAMLFAQGLVLPNSSAVALSGHPTVAGRASALLGFLQSGLGALVGWIASLLHNGTTFTLAVFMCGGWIATALIQVALFRHGRRVATGA